MLMIGLLVSGSLGADDRFIIEGTVKGQPVHFAVDTGAGVEFVVWQKTATRLGLKTSQSSVLAEPTAGQIATAWTEPADLEVMGEARRESRFAVVDTPGVIRPDVDGLMGWPALQNRILVLAVADHLATLVERVPVSAAQWRHVALSKECAALILNAPTRPAGGVGRVLVDTGSGFGVMLAAERWLSWKAAHPFRASTMVAYYKPGAGLVVAEESWASELEVGGIVLHDVPVMEADATDRAAVGTDYTASLGLAALARLDLVLDGEAGVAYVHAASGSPPPYAHNRLGAVFVPRDEQSNDLVAAVAERSPAFEAGIRDGDVLQKIDGLDVTQFRTQPGILPLSRFWNQSPGTLLALELRRGGEIFHVKVGLRNLLGSG
jgi:hypothetical protein